MAIPERRSMTGSLGGKAAVVTPSRVERRGRTSRSHVGPLSDRELSAEFESPAPNSSLTPHFSSLIATRSNDYWTHCVLIGRSLVTVCVVTHGY